LTFSSSQITCRAWELLLYSAPRTSSLEFFFLVEIYTAAFVVSLFFLTFFSLLAGLPRMVAPPPRSLVLRTLRFLGRSGVSAFFFNTIGARAFDPHSHPGSLAHYFTCPATFPQFKVVLFLGIPDSFMAYHILIFLFHILITLQASSSFRYVWFSLFLGEDSRHHFFWFFLCFNFLTSTTHFMGFQFLPGASTVCCGLFPLLFRSKFVCPLSLHIFPFLLIFLIFLFLFFCSVCLFLFLVVVSGPLFRS